MQTHRERGAEEEKDGRKNQEDGIFTIGAEILAVMKPRDLGDVVKWSDEGVAQDEHLERHDECQPQRHEHEANVEAVQLKGAHPDLLPLRRRGDCFGDGVEGNPDSLAHRLGAHGGAFPVLCRLFRKKR